MLEIRDKDCIYLLLYHICNSMSTFNVFFLLISMKKRLNVGNLGWNKRNNKQVVVVVVGGGDGGGEPAGCVWEERRISPSDQTKSPPTREQLGQSDDHVNSVTYMGLSNDKPKKI